MKLPARRFAGLALKLAAFVLLGGVFLVGQIDRSARSSAGFAMAVPSGIGGSADVRKARSLVESRPLAAQQLMAGALALRPLSIENLGLYARAATEGDDLEVASQALTLASGRGWRDAYVQIMILGSALDQGQYDAAALRLEALARGQQDQSVVSVALNRMLQKPEGRNVVADRLAKSPGMDRKLYLSALQSADDIPLYAETINLAERGQAQLDCATLERFTQIALSRSDVETTAMTWPMRCRQRSPNDLSFDFSETPDPFGWKMFDDPRVATREGSERETLYLMNRDMVQRNVASKYLELEEGSYALSYTSRNPRGISGSGAKALLDFSMFCGSWRSERNIPLRENGEQRLEFSVGPECERQFLLLQSRRGKRDDLAFKLEKLS